MVAAKPASTTWRLCMPPLTALPNRSVQSSSRWMKSSTRRPRSGSPRARPSSRPRPSTTTRLTAPVRRAPSSSTWVIRSALTGTAISAAALGVGARWSAAKSIKVVSASWPTAEISGMVLAYAARTTDSSLNAIRSSRLPPPRATISTSGRGTLDFFPKALKPLMAAVISVAAFLPCTVTGHNKTCLGKRSSRRCRISRNTAPDSDVTTPITSGRNGRSFLASRSNRPSAANFLRRSSSSFNSAPSPAIAKESTTIW